ncbi:DUF4352 domain-containing protein [Micromonospora halotolerans]|uniref:DUF4352 domain-containing protein n=1 Tax=Micromonospora halotolerans TaxID=709879 RepID=A0ABY9ZX65_9ACTN|nr:DUF4352 domain-containing protein [Micromonospora halotolerans]WNM39165.1 DUF4352 domain-containing protein [Micromonospora halotolerans]
MTRAHYAAAFALVTVLAGCGGGPEKPVTVGATLAPTSAAPATSTPAASPSASPSQDGMLAIGQTFTFENNTMTTSVLGYKQPIGEASRDMKKEGEAFGGLEVNTCNLASASEPRQVNVLPWSLELPDGTTTSHRWSGVVSAEYPYSPKTLKPGRCVKGWIVFTVPAKGEPSVAVYEGQGNQGQPAEWKLS